MTRISEINKLLENNRKILDAYSKYSLNTINTISKINENSIRFNELLNTIPIKTIDDTKQEYEKIINSINAFPTSQQNFNQTLKIKKILDKELELSKTMLTYNILINENILKNNKYTTYFLSNYSNSYIYQNITQFLSNINFTPFIKKYENRFDGDYNKHLDLYIRKHNWILPQFATKKFIKSLKEGFDNDLDIDIIFVEFFKKDNYNIMDLMKNKWNDDDLIPKDSYEIIIKSIDLFKNSDESRHYFIIPVLLAQIDNLLNLVLIKHGYKKEGSQFIKENMNHETKGNFKTFNYHVAPNIVDEWEEHHLKYLLDGLFKSSYGEECYEGDIMPFNRHTIMHGLCYDYGTIENTIRCYLIIDFLNDFLSDEDTIRLNH